MKIQLVHGFDEIICLENLLEAWQEFLRGKRNKKDVQAFSLGLLDNLLALRNDLLHGSYKHGGYQAFNISDPKPRSIHKASVRDRLLHHAIYRILYPFFEKTFIADSYSCRIGRGTHRASLRFRHFAAIVGKNNTRTCWVLKCDVRKFFASVDHNILLAILREYVPEEKVMGLLEEIVGSFPSGKAGKGLPLGNLTSQLFVNIYMNRFDQFVKHRLKARFYIRYSDDFVIFSENKQWLKEQVKLINTFLWRELHLELHPGKVSIETLSSGVDFLGTIHFPDHRVLRTKTRRRMFRKLAANNEQLRNGFLSEASFGQSLESYRGILSHVNGHRTLRRIGELFPS